MDKARKAGKLVHREVRQTNKISDLERQTALTARIEAKELFAALANREHPPPKQSPADRDISEALSDDRSLARRSPYQIATGPRYGQRSYTKRGASPRAANLPQLREGRVAERESYEKLMEVSCL